MCSVFVNVDISCLKCLLENKEVYKEQGWEYKDVFNKIKCYHGRGDAFTITKSPLFSLYVDEHKSIL